MVRDITVTLKEHERLIDSCTVNVSDEDFQSRFPQQISETLKSYAQQTESGGVPHYHINIEVRRV